MKHGTANLMLIYQGSLQIVFCPVPASSVKLPWFLSPPPFALLEHELWLTSHSAANTPGAFSRTQSECKRCSCTQVQHLALQVCCSSRSKTGRSEKAVLKKVSELCLPVKLLSLGSVRWCLPNLSAWFWVPSAAALCWTCYGSVTP